MEQQSYSLHPTLINWRAVFAGLFVALLAYSILFFLGVGVGGVALVRTLRAGGGGAAISSGTMIWLTLSTIISLVVGGAFAARVSIFVTPRIGAAQGFVIAGLFHSVMWAQMVLAAGAVSLGVTSAAGFAASQLDQSSVISDAVESALGGAGLKSDTGTVARELTARILRGDTEAARNYLASQTDVADLDQRLVDIQNKAMQAATGTAKAVAGVGWTLFLTVLLSSAGALWGGGMGSRNNHIRLMDADEAMAVAS
jgi:hypothetical protein